MVDSLSFVHTEYELIWSYETKVMVLGKLAGHHGRAGPVGHMGHFGKVDHVGLAQAAGALAFQAAIVSNLSSILPKYELIRLEETRVMAVGKFVDVENLVVPKVKISKNFPKFH
jgi:hypothetical protein